jgi:CRP-like cAMP-binding protein
LSLENLEFPANGIVGLVTDSSTDPALVLSILAAGHNADSWRETLDGHRLRTHQVNLDVMLVPDDPSGFNSTIREQIYAVAPDLADSHIRALLKQVGIDDFSITDNGLDTPLGPGSALLTPNERQRLSLAIALAAAPSTLLVGPLISLADSETARPLLKIIRESNVPNIIVCLRDPDMANEVDLVLYCTAKGHQLATHEELLVSSPEYSQLWSRRLSTGEIDLSSIGIEPGQQENLLTRMLTERYETGDYIYRQGAPADRVVFIISGSVEIATQSDDGQQRRVAILGPGNHCGDLRLTVGEERGEHAIAVQTTVTRSLSREAISAGMMGLLDRTPAERRIVASILREGSSTLEEISARLTEFDPAELSKAIDLLLSDGALRESEGRYSVIQKRAVKAGGRALLDKLNFD